MKRRHSPTPMEPPGWFWVFILEDWVRADGGQRYPAGAPMPVEEVAHRRWLDACRQWARDNEFSFADRLRERRAARRRAQGWDP